MKTQIKKPKFLINKEKIQKNINRMKSKAEKNNVELRPHFKTHQSLEVGKIYRECGIDKITVSSVEMAEFFAKDGWNDITIAFPINILEIEAINNLNNRINLKILVESIEVLEKIDFNIEKEISAFVKIDTGYHRTGIIADDFRKINKVVEAISRAKKIKFLGFLAHEGHSYHSKSKEDIIEIHKDSKRKMINLKRKFSSHSPLISVGSTPTCVLAEDFSGIDEIRPGNFVYFDIMQENLGVCSFNEISVCLACPIVAKHSERNEIVVYGGGIHLSKEFIEVGDRKIYGFPVNLEDRNLPLEESYVKSLSQEHGIIKLNERDFNLFQVGDLIGILPVHSCMTANLMR